ncbi:MAG: hypothetical protein EP297_16155 [Gammaproteobacteria bacterium]|nr:MAG: hypothetical protein EP297_16155 [Gammaproteobacteria bacterium]
MRDAETAKAQPAAEPTSGSLNLKIEFIFIALLIIFLIVFLAVFGDKPSEKADKAPAVQKHPSPKAAAPKEADTSFIDKLRGKPAKTVEADTKPAKAEVPEAAAAPAPAEAAITEAAVEAPPAGQEGDISVSTTPDQSILLPPTVKFPEPEITDTPVTEETGGIATGAAAPSPFTPPAPTPFTPPAPADFPPTTLPTQIGTAPETAPMSTAPEPVMEAPAPPAAPADLGYRTRTPSEVQPTPTVPETAPTTTTSRPVTRPTYKPSYPAYPYPYSPYRYRRSEDPATRRQGWNW